ncbi:MAG: malonyl-CoA decarboxylase [Sulfitobacter sp.]
MSRNNVLSDLMARVGEIGGRILSTNNAHDTLPLADLCEELLSHRGEATGAAIGQAIFDRFDGLDAHAKHAFFEDLNSQFGVDTQAMQKAFSAWHESKQTNDARACHFQSEPKSQELIRRLNRVPNGTVRLIEMRNHLLRALKSDPTLRGLDDDFRHLLGSWFNRGFLELRRIDWDTSAEVLEKIIAYEAVHEIKGWEDLRRRVAAPDRRLYAFFHPALSNEPLIFVEVALSDGIPSAIAPIICAPNSTTEPKEATTAVFYSISNCQKGLRGISFGSFLIKQVVRELRREFDTLETFVTLSPVPGLRAWAQEAAIGAEPALLCAEDLSLIADLEASNGASTDPHTHAGLMRIAAKYLVHGTSARGGPADPVARFHLGNGACLEQINPAADLSDRGMATSWGVMVNYLYDLKNIERNHEVFANGGDVICSALVKRAAHEN